MIHKSTLINTFELIPLNNAHKEKLPEQFSTRICKNSILAAYD